MGKAPCCDKSKVKKGPWSPEEDIKLKEFIEKNGTGGNWIALPQKAGLKRCGKSCRLRWLNYLRPNIKHGDFTDDEDRVICTLFATIGSRWSIIAAQLPGRTDNDIKNYWNTKLKKKLLGIPPAPRKSNQQQMKHQNHNQQQLFQSSLDHNINVNITPPTTTSYSSFGTLESTQILPPLLHTNELPYSYQLGFENNNYIDYCGFEGTHSLLIGSNGSSSDQEAPPLDLDGINYEELNQMVCLKNSNWCSGLNVEDPSSTNICFRNQERVMCSYNN